jgi:phosphatidylserine/phosphatidylglycerophosphate/cardiolipin synthase-like enzyme
VIEILDDDPLADLETQFFASGERHHRDTEVIAHVDGGNYFAAIQTALDQAVDPEDVIYISSWLINGRTTLTFNGPMLHQILHDKAALGMDGRVSVWTGRFRSGKDAIDNRSCWDTEFAGSAEKHGGFAAIVQGNIMQVRDFRAFNPNNLPKPPLEGSVLMDHGGGKWGSRHQKTTIVYHKATNDLRAFVGGIDYDQSRATFPRHVFFGNWHDTGVELRGGAAMSVWRDFGTRWHEATRLREKTFRIEGEDFPFNNAETLSRPPVPDPPQVSVQSDYSVRILRSYAGFAESPVFDRDEPWDSIGSNGIREILPTYVKAINAPQQVSPLKSYIYVEDQDLNREDIQTEHDTLFPFIVQAANRDIRVIFVVPGSPDPADPGHNRNEHQSITIQSMIRQIAPDKRVNFVMYRVKDTIIHSKVMIINDKFVALGSANFLDRSMEGLDTELQACVVNTGTLAQDLRIRLWADHLRVDPTNPQVRSELADLTKSLGFFNENWGSGITFNHDDSAFDLVRP